MWSDNDTDRDFLNFTGVAETVAEIIVQAEGKPVSIGVSGAWGVGKSSMIRLIRKSLSGRKLEGKHKFLFVEFNAWLYQGYDDARAALMDVIAESLKKEAEAQKTSAEKIQELLGRIDWLRVAKVTAGTAASFALGLGPMGLIGEVFQLGKRAAAGDIDQKLITDVEAASEKVAGEAARLVKGGTSKSPPKEIQALRECFEQMLDALDITLVVLIDDLDRCLPETTISTLEAIRLFLFLKDTAFVIAADNAMIRHAMKRHFQDVDDELVINYFDKLIQVPIRVPPLGTQEVRAYLLMLFIDNSGLGEAAIDQIRSAVCKQLGSSWQGKRVDRTFLQTLGIKFDSELVARLDTADRLAPLMTTSARIAGNPRIIKRFLNALSIRMSIAKAHGIGLDEAALAKVLLFERCGAAKAYAELITAVQRDEQGKAAFLAEWEKAAAAGETPVLQANWDDDFVRDWLAVPPALAEVDLRGVLYVSREHAPLITPEDRLSSEAIDILSGLIEHPDMAADLKDRIAKLARAETAVIMDRLLQRAQRVQEWGLPPLLEALLTVARADPAQGERLAAFLTSRPANQITTAIVPKIDGEPWADDVYARWSKMSVRSPVKKAIEQRNNGNVTIK